MKKPGMEKFFLEYILVLWYTKGIAAIIQLVCSSAHTSLLQQRWFVGLTNPWMNSCWLGHWLGKHRGLFLLATETQIEIKDLRNIKYVKNRAVVQL